MRSTTRAWRRNAFCRPGRLTLGEEDVPERAGLTTRRERRERVPITRDSLVEGKRHRAFDRGHAGSRGILPPGLALQPGYGGVERFLRDGRNASRARRAGGAPLDRKSTRLNSSH